MIVTRMKAVIMLIGFVGEYVLQPLVLKELIVKADIINLSANVQAIQEAILTSDALKTRRNRPFLNENVKKTRTVAAS